MAALPTVFPVLVLAATVGLVLYAIRLDRRLSRGARSAGPRDVVRPRQMGLQRTPWELKALDDQVRAVGNGQARHDLVQTVNRLTMAAGPHDPEHLLPSNAGDAMISAVVDHLERRLDLPGPPPTPGGPWSGTAQR